MFQRSALLALATTLLLTVTALETSAGERTRRHHHGHRFDHHGIHRVVIKPRINVRQRVVINIQSRGRRHDPRGVNTYSGAVDVDYRPGIGTWSYGATSYIAPSARDRTPTVKIIDIGSGKTDCSMEHGVCVIRN